MDKDSELPVFTVINNEDSLGADLQNEEKSIIFYTVNEEGALENNESEETTSYFVQDNAVIQQFDASTVFSSDVRIVRVDNGYLYIATDDDENVQSIEPHLITSQDVDEQETIANKPFEASKLETNEISEPEDTNINIKVIEPYEMIMLNEVDKPEIYFGNMKKKFKWFKCLYTGCEKVYSTAQHLNVHMRNHMKRKPYACTFQGCEKNFATNYSLTAHCRTHTGEKPYTCQVCSKSFKTSGDLQKHVRTHTGEKPFMCPIEGCGKSFTTSNIRKVHVRSHTGERPYVCDYPNCGKAFSSSTNYKNHARIHSGEKPYVCNVKGCDKKFTEYSSLYKHNAVHQVDKPHECNYCKLKFKSEHTLNVHRKVKHGVLMSPDGVQLLDIESLGQLKQNISKVYEINDL